MMISKNDLPDVLDRAHDLGVNRFIYVATNMEDARESHENIFRVLCLSKGEDIKKINEKSER
jgi:hypothetical protein